MWQLALRGVVRKRSVPPPPALSRRFVVCRLKRCALPTSPQPAHADLRSINFRQNLLSDLSAWNTCSCKGTLEDLEFRDNEVSTVGVQQR